MSLSHRLLLALFGAAAGFLLAESAARFAGVEWRPHMKPRLYFQEYDELFGWRNRHGISGPYVRSEFSTKVTIENDGLRRTLNFASHGPAVSTIAVIGDSQAWGDGVNDEETFASLIASPRRRVLNFAVPGYGTDQELLTLVSKVSSARPDVVVLSFFSGNDIHDNLSRGTYQYPKPYYRLNTDGKLELRGIPVPSLWPVHYAALAYREIMSRSAVLNRLAELPYLDPTQKRATADGWTLRLPAPWYRAGVLSRRDRAGMELSARLLLEEIRETRAIGARPIVLLLPDSWQTEIAASRKKQAVAAEERIDWRRPQKFIRRHLAREHVQIIDALPLLAKQWSSHPKKKPFFREWNHLTAAGHKVVAEVLRPALAEASWERGRPRPHRSADGGVSDPRKFVRAFSLTAKTPGKTPPV